MKRNLDKLGVQYDTISVDDKAGAKMASGYKVMALPAFLVVKDDKPSKVVTGLIPIDKLKTMLHIHNNG